MSASVGLWSTQAAAGGVETHNHIGILMVDCPPPPLSTVLRLLGCRQGFHVYGFTDSYIQIWLPLLLAARRPFRVLAPEHCFDLTYLLTTPGHFDSLGEGGGAGVVVPYLGLDQGTTRAVTKTKERQREREVTICLFRRDIYILPTYWATYLPTYYCVHGCVG